MVRLTIEELEQISDLKMRFAEKIDSKISELYALSLQQQRLKAKLTDQRTEIFQIQHKINALNADLAVSQLALEFDMFDALSEPAKKSMQEHWLCAVARGASASAAGHPFHGNLSSGFVSPLCQSPPIDMHCPNCTLGEIVNADAFLINRELPLGIQ